VAQKASESLADDHQGALVGQWIYNFFVQATHQPRS